MPDESHFLSAIDDRPDDRAARLVYADWLEERGKAQRAELIRVEEEMRGLPAHSGRYWELKPRRHALRRRCDAAWLARLRYGADYEPTFADVPDGWRERWRLVREFTERWHRVGMPDVGGHAAKVRRAEKKAGRTLPPAVREWVAYWADLEKHGAEEILRDVFVVERLEELGAVSLLLQGEGDVYWAVREENLDQPDPPVECFTLDDEGEDEDEAGFVHDRLASARVTGFVLGHLLLYSHGEGGGMSVEVGRKATLRRQLARLPGPRGVRRVGDLRGAKPDRHAPGG